MSRWGLVAGLLLAGCASDQGAKTLMLLDATAIYHEVRFPLHEACRTQRLPAETCKTLAAGEVEFQALDASVRKDIAAGNALDWSRLSQIVDFALKAAGALGALGIFTP